MSDPQKRKKEDRSTSWVMFKSSPRWVCWEDKWRGRSAERQCNPPASMHWTCTAEHCPDPWYFASWYTRANLYSDTSLLHCDGNNGKGVRIRTNVSNISFYEQKFLFYEQNFLFSSRTVTNFGKSDVWNWFNWCFSAVWEPLICS
jgi:hypothetical protein